MERRYQKGQEEHHQDLAVDGSLDLPPLEADLLHDLEPLAILVPFGNLLVVDDEYRRHQEQHPQEHAQEEEAAVHVVALGHVHGLGVGGEGEPGAGAGEVGIVFPAIVGEGVVVSLQLFFLRAGEGGEERPLHGAAVGGLKLLVEIQQRCIVRHHHADPAGLCVIGADHGRPAAGGREIVEEFFDLEGAGLAGNFLGLKTVVGQGQGVRQLPSLAPHQHLVTA